MADLISQSICDWNDAMQISLNDYVSHASLASNPHT